MTIFTELQIQSQFSNDPLFFSTQVQVRPDKPDITLREALSKAMKLRELIPENCVVYTVNQRSVCLCFGVNWIFQPEFQNRNFIINWTLKKQTNNFGLKTNPDGSVPRLRWKKIWTFQYLVCFMIFVILFWLVLYVEKRTTLHVFFFLDCRKLVNWDTEITDLAGQEISVEHKEHIPFPPRSSLSHNFVSTGYFYFMAVHTCTHHKIL